MPQLKQKITAKIPMKQLTDMLIKDDPSIYEFEAIRMIKDCVGEWMFDESDNYLVSFDVVISVVKGDA